MEREQRYKHEMFVRVRDFGAARREVFPESSGAGRAFARVAAALAAIDGHLRDHIVASTKVREVKASTREAVYERMKAIARTGRRVSGDETGATPFRMPLRRGISAELATARAFIQEVNWRRAAFARFDLPPAFVDEFRALVAELQDAQDVRLSSRTVRRQALAGIKAELERGMDAARDLDAMVPIATAGDPATYAAWTSARRIDGLRSRAAAAKRAPGDAPVVTTPAATPAPSAQPLPEVGKAA